jgi:hypothetical protein
MIVDLIIGAIATGGAKTVADVIKIIAKQFGELFKMGKKLIDDGLNKGKQIIVSLFDEIIAIFANIRRSAKNIKPFLDEILEWLKKFFDDIYKVRKRKFGEITKEIMKSEMPEDFLEAIMKMGKTEDEIIEYFTKYHNENDYIFLNDIEDIIAKFKNITKTDAFALWSYTTNHYYFELNSWLRNGINISNTTKISKLITNALNKMPKYSGISFRALEFNDVAVLQSFLKNHNTGSIVEYNEFVSCGTTTKAAFFNKPKKNVFLKMEVKNAPIISAFADGIKIRGYAKDELLLLQGRKFEVEYIKIVDRGYEIKLIEK